MKRLSAATIVVLLLVAFLAIRLSSKEAEIQQACERSCDLNPAAVAHLCGCVTETTAP